jgi:hypothetical protein
LVLPIIAYTLSSTKLERRANSFCLVARGFGGKERSRGVRGGREEGGRNDPNIVCTYKYNKKRKKRNLP